MLRKLLQRRWWRWQSLPLGEALEHAGLRGAHAVLESAGLHRIRQFRCAAGASCRPALQASLDADGDFDVRRFAALGLLQIDPLLIVKGLPNAGLCGIAIEHRVLGPNLNIANGSMGGAQALATAARAIADGDIDVAVAGAYDSVLPAEHLVAETLSGRASPPGEGAVMWVIESEPHARARGVRLLAAVAGACESSGSPDTAIAGALRDSGMSAAHAHRHRLAG